MIAQIDRTCYDVCMNKNYKYYLLPILLAIYTAITSFRIPVAENLRIQITFLVGMLIAIIYPAKILIPFGAALDITGFVVFPSGSFFPGYTLSTIAGLLVYRFFLHKKVDFWHVLFARLTVNLLVNVGMGSLWSSMMFSKGYLYYATKSLTKNLILLPVEVFLFLLFWKLLQASLKKYQLIKE